MILSTGEQQLNTVLRFSLRTPLAHLQHFGMLIPIPTPTSMSMLLTVCIRRRFLSSKRKVDRELLSDSTSHTLSFDGIDIDWSSGQRSSLVRERLFYSLINYVAMIQLPSHFFALLHSFEGLFSRLLHVFHDQLMDSGRN